jgi:hypothetical protein
MIFRTRLNSFFEKSHIQGKNRGQKYETMQKIITQF